MQDGGLENTWLMDSGCSRHMTGNSKWFSSLDPVIGKEYITFGDKSRGKVFLVAPFGERELYYQGCCFGFEYAFQSAYSFATP
jgi:hypothetical protein